MYRTFLLSLCVFLTQCGFAQIPTVTLNGYEAQIRYPNGKSYATSRDEAASMFYQMCVDNYENGKTNEAVQCINLAYMCDNKNALVLYMRGLLEEKTNKIDEALADFNASIKYNDRYAQSYAHRGAIKGMKSDYQGAVNDLKKAWALSPNNAQVAYQLGQTLVVLNKKSEARKYLKYAVKNGISAAQTWLDKCEKQ